MNRGMNLALLLDPVTPAACSLQSDAAGSDRSMTAVQACVPCWEGARVEEEALPHVRDTHEVDWQLKAAVSGLSGDGFWRFQDQEHE